MTSYLPKVLTFVVLVAVVIALTFAPNLWAKARERWPGVFETDNPIPDAMPESYMIYFIVAVVAIIVIGVVYGGVAAFFAMMLALVVGLVLMHGVPYIRHQYRRIIGRTHGSKC